MIDGKILIIPFDEYNDMQNEIANLKSALRKACVELDKKHFGVQISDYPIPQMVQLDVDDIENYLLGKEWGVSDDETN